MGSGSSLALPPLDLSVNDQPIVLHLSDNQSIKIRLHVNQSEIRRLQTGLNLGDHVSLYIKLLAASGTLKYAYVNVPTTEKSINQSINQSISYENKLTNQSINPNINPRHQCSQMTENPEMILTMLAHETNQFNQSIYTLTINNSIDRLILSVEFSSMIIKPFQLINQCKQLQEKYDQSINQIKELQSINQSINQSRDRIDQSRKNQFITSKDRQILTKHFQSWRIHSSNKSINRTVIINQSIKSNNQQLKQRCFAAWRVWIQLNQQEKWREMAQKEREKRILTSTLANLLSKQASFFLRWKMYIHDRKVLKTSVLAKLAEKRELGRSFHVFQHWRKKVFKTRSEILARAAEDKARAEGKSLVDAQSIHNQSIIAELKSQVEQHKQQTFSVQREWEAKNLSLADRLIQEKRKRAAAVIQSISQSCISTAFMQWKRLVAMNKSERKKNEKHEKHEKAKLKEQEREKEIEERISQALKQQSTNQSINQPVIEPPSVVNESFVNVLVDSIPKSKQTVLSKSEKRALVKKVFTAWKSARIVRHRLMRQSINQLVQKRLHCEQTNTLRQWMYRTQIFQSNNQSANQSISQSINQSINQSVDPSVIPFGDSSNVRLAAELRALQRMYSKLYRLVTDLREESINQSINQYKMMELNQSHECRCEVCHLKKQNRMNEGPSLKWIRIFDQQIAALKFVR